MGFLSRWPQAPVKSSSRKSLPPKFLPPCPYCGKPLDPAPKRQRKCKACGKNANVLRSSNRRARIVTERAFDAHWRRERDKEWAALQEQAAQATGQGDLQSARMAY